MIITFQFGLFKAFVPAVNNIHIGLSNSLIKHFQDNQPLTLHHFSVQPGESEERRYRADQKHNPKRVVYEVVQIQL